MAAQILKQQNPNQREPQQPESASTYKMSPQLNKGAVCFSTADSSCHLPCDEALLAAATACQFYLPHFVTSDTSHFTNSLTPGQRALETPPQKKNRSDTQTRSLATSCCLTSRTGDVAHLKLAPGTSSLPASRSRYRSPDGVCRPGLLSERSPESSDWI